jgi:hypothetical protein
MAVYEIHETYPGGRGEALGALARAPIQAFLQDDLAQVLRLRRKPLAVGRLLAVAGAYHAYLHEHLPHLAEEVAGLARGADITVEQAMLLQCRRELCGWDEDCTLVADARAGGGVIAQTIDLAGDLALHVGAVHYRHGTRDGGALWTWNYTGLLGYMGMNGHGLAVGINMVLSEGWGIGVPPYLLVRHLLGFAKLDECIAEISRLRCASSRSLILLQDGRLLNVEMTVDRHRHLQGDRLGHSNHYLHPELQDSERLIDGASSHGRLERILALAGVADAEGGLTSPALRAILADHKELPGSICHHDMGMMRGHTVSAVILHPQQALVEACFGYPCRDPFTTFQL